MNLKNTIENLAISIVVFLVGAYAGHKITNITTKSLISKLQPTIEKAIDKETINNSIYNAIDNNFEKIKKSDSIKIIISQDPINDLKPKNKIQVKQKNCEITTEQFNSLSKNQKSRIKRWLKF